MPTLEQAFERFRARLPDRARLYVAGCAGEPLALANLFETRPDLAAGLTFVGIWIPGINRTDWTGFHAESRAESIFLMPEFRQSFEAGRTAFLPLSYTGSVAWLSQTTLDGVIAVTTPPDANDRVSLGVSPDFTGTVLSRTSIPALALLTEEMPRPEKSVEIEAQRFVETVDTAASVRTVAPASLSPAFEPLAQRIASIIGDGSVLQFGLGSVQAAVLAALKDHRALRIHSGMISDPVMALIDAGALSSSENSLTTGVALGSSQLYERLAAAADVRFAPVSHTHAITTLASIERFTAINSAIEVDLFGQVNAEFISGRQVSGTGGLPDFLRGAAAAPNGKSIIALTSTAKAGKVSRIVPRLAPGTTSISRGDVHLVATEHGIANLRHCNIDQRAERLIAIADPTYRDQLAGEWDRMRRAM